MRRLVPTVFTWCLVYIAYADEFAKFQRSCDNAYISFNFSGMLFTELSENFIGSPLITCMNLTGIEFGKIHNRAFAQLPNLNRLYLSHHYLNSESFVISFDDLPSLEVLVIKHGLTAWSEQRAVLKNVFPKLRYLSLRNNSITEFIVSDLERNPWNGYNEDFATQLSDVFPELEYLDLSENMIRTAQSLLFPVTLKHLNVSHNSISSFTEKRLPKLETLILDSNEIRIISPCGYYMSCLELKYFNNLRHLSVRHNPLETVNSDAFRYTTNLEYLDLSGNRLKTLSPTTFEHLKSLKILRIACNGNTEWPVINMELQIEELDLRHNHIGNLSYDMLQNMTHLRKLYLSNNDISSINKLTFSTLSELEILDLGMNSLSSFDEGWSASLNNLRILNLNDNLFTSLESLVLPNTMPIIDIYLGKNPLSFLKSDSFRNLPDNATVYLNSVTENTIDCLVY